MLGGSGRMRKGYLKNIAHVFQVAFRAWAACPLSHQLPQFGFRPLMVEAGGLLIHSQGSRRIARHAPALFISHAECIVGLTRACYGLRANRLLIQSFGAGPIFRHAPAFFIQSANPDLGSLIALFGGFFIPGAGLGVALPHAAVFSYQTAQPLLSKQPRPASSIIPPFFPPRKAT